MTENRTETDEDYGSSHQREAEEAENVDCKYNSFLYVNYNR